MPSSPAVICECGKQVSVSERDFGDKTQCGCGTFLVVPTAPEFERQPLQPTATTILARLQRLKAAGALPTLTRCVCCDEECDRIVIARVDCEQSEVVTSGGFGSGHASMQALLLVITLPLGLFVFVRPQEQRFENRGRDTMIDLPVHLCWRCHEEQSKRSWGAWIILAVGCLAAIALGVSTSFWWALLALPIVLIVAGMVNSLVRTRRQKRLKECVGQEPVYGQLLRKYRYATVGIVRWHEDEQE